ncbi:hypothetical protein [Lentzea aerocolonigenes]|nr:hypothetical protein [Lentzea aerocolonigenes]
MALTLKPADQELRHGRLVPAVEAPTHPLVDEFWEVVTFVLDNDQTLRS